jgi:transcriptional regulator with XRE-family HTH domain
LAWKEESNPDRWVNLLRKKAGLTEKAAKATLDGAQLTGKDRAAIIEGFGIDGDELGTARLFGLSSEEILIENIRYLINSLPKGEKQTMAGAVQVAKESVSRWATGKNPPSPQNIQQILQYLKLDPGVNLYEVPLFLSLRPIGHFAQREWLQKQVASLPSEELSKLFPALEKMFDHHEDS